MTANRRGFLASVAALVFVRPGPALITDPVQQVGYLTPMMSTWGSPAVLLGPNDGFEYSSQSVGRATWDEESTE